jgi:hypothetical protein
MLQGQTFSIQLFPPSSPLLSSSLSVAAENNDSLKYVAPREPKKNSPASPVIK